MPSWKRHAVDQKLIEAALGLKNISVRWINDWHKRRYEAILTHGDMHVRMSVGRAMKRAQIVAKVTHLERTYHISYEKRCGREYVNARMSLRSEKGQGYYENDAPRWNKPGKCFCDSCCMHRYLVGEVDTPSKILQIKQWEENIKHAVTQAAEITPKETALGRGEADQTVPSPDQPA